MVQNIDKLELPNQLVAVLADPLLQKLLLLRPSEEAYQRVANWLNFVLQDVIDGNADEATLWDLLDVVRDFVTQTQVRIHVSTDGHVLRLRIADTTISSSQLLCTLLPIMEWFWSPRFCPGSIGVRSVT